MAERYTKEGRTFIEGLTFDQAWTFLSEPDHWSRRMGYQDDTVYVSARMEAGPKLFESTGRFTMKSPATDDQKAAKDWWISD